METSDWIAIGAIIVSIIAFIISAIAIWKTHFAKFSPVLTVGNCTFRIYPIKSDNQRWYISSFDIPVSITNKGAQLGKLEDIRIKVSFPQLPIPNNFEIFDAKWIVDGQKITRNRFKWIDKAVIENWMPIIILPKETKTKHIVFETRWDEPVIQEKIMCSLEIKTDNANKWIKIIDWNHYLSKDIWIDLSENGCSYSSSPNIDNSLEIKIHPTDLHKYTGTKEDLTKIKVESSPSYLDYSDKD